MAETPSTDAMKSPDAPGDAPASLDPIDAELGGLPSYARGLLNIRVPVQVTLASQRTSIQEIIELGPGSIVKFDKTYDEALELMVGNRPLAQGEVVKVGDKFGLRIRGLVQ
jgi:flagellar motor switch protein FliN